MNDTAAAELNYNASGDVTTPTRLKKWINKGFPTGVHIAVGTAASVCVFGLFLRMHAYRRTTCMVQLICVEAHTKTHTYTHTHTVCSSHLRGEKEAGSRNGKRG